MQVTAVELDADTGVLSIRLTDQSQYRIQHAGYARQVMASISPGGRLSGIQLEWLEQFRVESFGGRKDRLQALYRQLRKEIKEGPRV